MTKRPKGWKPSTDPWYQKLAEEQAQRHEERFSQPPFGWKEYPKLPFIAVKFVGLDGEDSPAIMIDKTGIRGLMEAIDVFYQEQQWIRQQRSSERQKQSA